MIPFKSPLTEREAQPSDPLGKAASVLPSRSSKTKEAPGAAPLRDHGKWVEVWRKQGDGAWRMRWDIFNSDVPSGAGQ